MAANLDIIIRAQNQASGVFNSLKRDMQSFSQQAQSVGTALSLGVTAPFALFAKTGIQTTAEFSRTMAELEVVTGATGDSLDTLTDTAIRLGAETSFSANEAASAMLELSKAGMDTEEVLASIPGVLSLAAAGGVDLAYAANLTASSLNAFQLSADQAGYVSNLLAAAANESSANISDLAYGLQQGGFAFNAAGQDVDDLAASLAILTNVGLTGSDAGTALKNAFTRLMSPTDDAAKLMAALNLRFYDAQGTMLPLADIIGILNDKLGGMTDEQRNAALVTLFLNDGMKAMIPLMDLGKDGFLEMKDAVNQVGVAQKVADAKMRGLAGAFEYASGSIESAMLTVFRPLEKTLAALVRAGGDFVTWLSQLPRPMIDAALAFTAVLAAAGPLLLAIPAIGALFAALASTLGLVVLAVAVLAAAWASNFGNIQGITFAAVDAIVGSMRQLWTAIATGDFGPLLKNLAQAWDNIKAWAVNVYNTLLENVPLWAAAIASWATNAWTTAQTSLTTYVESVKTWITTQAPLIVEKVTEWATAFTAWADNAWATLSPILTTFWESLTTWISTQKDTLPEKITAWATEFTTWANDIWTELSTNLGTMWESLSGWISGQVDVLYSLLYKWATEFWTWAGEVWAELSPELDELIGNLKTWITAQGVALKDNFLEWLNGIDGFTEGMDTAFANIQAAWDFIAPIIENHVQRFKEAFQSFAEDIAPIGESFQRLWETIAPVLALLGITIAVVFNTILIVISSVISEAGAIFVTFVDTINGLIESAKNIFGGFIKIITSLFTGDWQGIFVGALQIFVGFVQLLTTVWDMGVRLIISLGNILWSTIVGIFEDMGIDLAAEIEAIRFNAAFVFAMIKSRVETLMEDAKNAIVLTWQQAKEPLVTAWDAIKSAGETAFNAIATAMDAIADAKDRVVEAVNQVKDFFKTLVINNPFSGILSTIETIISKAGQVVGINPGGSSGGGKNNAAGTPYYSGGMTTINERGTELIALPGRNRNVWLPRGAAIYPAERTPAMLGAGGGVTVNVYANVSNDMDVESMAYQIAAILRRNQK